MLTFEGIPIQGVGPIVEKLTVSYPRYSIPFQELMFYRVSAIHQGPTQGHHDGCSTIIEYRLQHPCQRDGFACCAILFSPVIGASMTFFIRPGRRQPQPTPVQPGLQLDA